MIPGAEIAAVKQMSQRIRQPLFAVLATIAVAASLVLSQGAASAQDLPTEITGTVIQGTPGATVPAGMTVVLLVVDEQLQQIIENESTVIGTNGRFTFTDILSGPGLTYRVAADDDEYTPSIDLRPGEDSFTDVELTIYDRTESLDDIRVSTFSMLVTGIDRGERLMGVLGVISVINSGDRVWIPDINNPNLTGFDLLRFNLPEGFTELSVETTLPPGNILDIATGFALTNPVPPGEYEILLTYLIQYEGDSLSYPLRLPYGADQVRIMLPEGKGDITGLGFGPTEGAIVVDEAYIVVNGVEYPRDSQLDVVFSSLPTPSLLEKTQSFFDGRGYIIAVGWVAAAAMFGLLIYAFFFSKRRRLVLQTSTPGSFPEYGGLGRDEIVDTIAKLDKEHDSGEIEDADYAGRRSALTHAALSAEKDEDEPK